MVQRMVEKRQYPRAPADFRMRLDPVRSATVRDISRAGVSCVTSSPLVPMTVVGLLLEIPVTGGDGYVEMPCQGVVVRSGVFQDASGTRYESAILFRDLHPAQQAAIDAYVSRRLSSPAG